MIKLNFTPEQKIEVLKTKGYKFKEIEKWFTESSYHNQVDTFHCKVLYPYKDESELNEKKIYMAVHHEYYHDDIDKLFDKEISKELTKMIYTKLIQ